MTKIENILILTNLLCNRQSVSVKTIMDRCKICKRTVYRYIQTLSEADIPVYFDKNLRGYRLLNKGWELPYKLNTDETLILLLSLNLLLSNVNDYYGPRIETIVKKILSKHSYELEKFYTDYSTNTGNKSNGQDISHLISSMIINYAVCSGKAIDLILNSDPDSKLRIRKPRMQISKEIYLSENYKGNNGSALLDDIDYVKLISPSGF